MYQDRYFLSECNACLEIIHMSCANCPSCGSFQMHVDWDYFDNKIKGFDLLAEHRYMIEERVEKLHKLGKGFEEIAMEKAEMDGRREMLAQLIMYQIEEKEEYLLN